MSAMNESTSRTMKASPAGNHETTLISSKRNISINFRGNGLLPGLPGIVGVPGDDGTAVPPIPSSDKLEFRL
jgi:hypothetical protein